MEKSPKLKIAIVADPELPVPPILYGGIERIIAMLIEGYIKLGHEVSLFANSDSKTHAKLFPYKGKTSNGISDVLKNTYLINKEIFSKKYDIIHSFGRLVYLLPQMPFSIPKLMSYQREPTITQIKMAKKFAKKESLAFTGCSEYISNQILPYAKAYRIFNGVDLEKFNCSYEIKDTAPLVFLGRIEPIKGVHLAIKIAKATNKKLIIAGNIPKSSIGYFEREIQPNLNDEITYVGEVDDIKKNELLGSAFAFLMPIEWNEPFGIVMTESMACGTPIIGMNRGSVPEIIYHLINGFICNNVEEMIDAVSKIGELDRRVVRADAEKRFSSNVIINQYLSLYNQLITNENITI